MALMTRQPRATGATQWDPFADLQQAFTELNRVLDTWQSAPGAGGEIFVPLADIQETEDAYVVEVELPGVSKDDVDISASGRRVSVSGERKETERVGILRRRTRSVGRFQFELTLPTEVDSTGITAELESGVLTLRLPKAAAERPRRIEVQEGAR